MKPLHRNILLLGGTLALLPVVLSASGSGASSKLSGQAFADAVLVAVKLDKGDANKLAARRDGIRQLVEAWQRLGDGDPRKLAYILATSWNETGFISLQERRGAPGSTTHTRQERYWYTGFYGRGLSQLTWQGNYEWAGRYLSQVEGKTIDLVANPDLALNSRYGALILVKGMIDGKFRSRDAAGKNRIKLADFFNDTTTDYTNARGIVNGDVSERGAPIGSIAATIRTFL